MIPYIYTAGPITGRSEDDCAYRFGSAERKVESVGFNAVNPYRGDQGLTWKEYMQQGIADMMGCQAIFMLSGWDKSQAARIERDLAHKLGYAVLYENIHDSGGYDDLSWYYDIKENKLKCVIDDPL